MFAPETEVVIQIEGAEAARHVVRPGEYVLGWAEDADLRVEAQLVSRRHARLTIHDDHALIEDLGSSNGTFVNGRPVSDSTRLWPGQKIQVGAATVELRRRKRESAPDVTLPPSVAAVQRLLPEEFLRDRKYDIGRIVAQGGMGAILDAHEATTERQVAMKVMLDGANPDDLARFIAEAKVTAQLEHPNIVPVHELSVDENGQVFYTMKMVRGITLRKVLDLMAAGTEATLAKYPLAALLTIFQKVCDAVAFAHAKGVIHRDLKPENIMLGDFGEVLVMDWGLAKVVGGGRRGVDAPTPGTDSAVPAVRTVPGVSGSTLAGTIMGTPQYMSPEQARGEVDSLDARTDIYALGAILFHILALRPAVTGRDAMAIVEKVARGEVAPLGRVGGTPAEEAEGNRGGRRMGEPGSRVSRDRTSELQNDANRGAERSFGQDAKTGGRDAHPARNRGIPDSLSAVVRKAMAFERDARYASVAELQADLAAYQGGFATRAEDAGAWRQFNLFLRRHRVLASSVAVSLLLIAFLSAVFTVRVIQERDRAERGEKTAREQRDTALRSQQETSAVLEFFQNEVLAAPRPEGQDRGKGRNITLMDAINAAEPKIGRGFSNQPLVEASIRGAMGMTYFYLGDLERASANHLKAAELRSSILGPEHPDTLKSRNHLANVYQNSGRNEQAISLYEDILNIRKENFGEEHPGSLESIHNLAIAYRAAGRLGEAIQLLEKMLPIQQAKLGTDHPGTQVAMSSLANAYHSMGRLAEAIALGEETVLLMKARLGADHPDTLTSMSDLAAAYEQTGRNADAIAIHEQTLSVRKDKLGTDHPDTLTSMNNLAFAYASAGRIEEAIALHQQTLVLRKSRLGEDHPHTLISMNNLALAYASAGRHEEAMALHEKALASRRATLGSDHPDTLTSMNNLALALTRADRLGEAIALHEQMLPLQKAKLGMDHRNTLSSMHNLASAYRYADRLDDAVALHAQALPLQKARLGPEHLDTIGTMVGLGQCLVLQGKTAEAEPMLRAAVQTLSDKNLTGWRVLDARCFLGRALSGQKKRAEAEPLLLDGYAGLKDQIARIPAGQRVRCLRSALAGLVQLYAQWDKPEEAARWRQELDEFNSRERTTPN